MSLSPEPLLPFPSFNFTNTFAFGAPKVTGHFITIWIVKYADMVIVSGMESSLCISPCCTHPTLATTPSFFSSMPGRRLRKQRRLAPRGRRGLTLRGRRRPILRKQRKPVFVFRLQGMPGNMKSNGQTHTPSPSPVLFATRSNLGRAQVRSGPRREASHGPPSSALPKLTAANASGPHQSSSPPAVYSIGFTICWQMVLIQSE